MASHQSVQRKDLPPEQNGRRFIVLGNPKGMIVYYGHLEKEFLYTLSAGALLFLSYTSRLILHFPSAL